jgi:hypothetical protein
MFVDELVQCPSCFEVQFFQLEIAKYGECGKLGAQIIGYICEEILFFPPFVKHCAVTVHPPRLLALML